MQIDINGRHFQLTDGLRNHVLAKMPKLDKYALKIETAHVIFEIQKIHQVCEIVIAGKNLRLTAIESTNDLYVSFDAAVVNLLKQLARYHDKIKHHRIKKISSAAEADQPTGEEDA